ncbi:tRNA (adenosine(37)-N6)-threonylcarbamoyltransferase complex ATPase subunit type 1 TsaE [Aquiflexum gelatinilyticum]|uniref:tRNA (adenosine(37)-N6)-threonylcarbamoyltransferase complex ATPase subunit type 1 TsaE n=1 Tax=Aquiflexum gelatinilyticum TaxID=2961943 RepID=UPI0021687274|nr:tRNA (adenosine(37)-N6)-threonylcarbamoyltransferase complex ATPase subunit type 1 TsaE [Aquiflexum gelatinilyticum]MCS4436366.1 tRNA (adenosine(37)-N6)-threonylcarbamoyltransferase complex ATPase subunit type 1 TsaE [Aquiflexum gelatinilyticum]
MEKFYCPEIGDLHETALKIVSFAGSEKIWVFKGDLGAGKTTLITELARVLGVEDKVSSPTFSLVNEYQNTKGEIFYHFDFYRVENPEEVFEIGIEEYFYSGNRCWIEWAEKIAAYIPHNFIHIYMEVDEVGGRMITLQRVINGETNG